MKKTVTVSYSEYKKTGSIYAKYAKDGKDCYDATTKTIRLIVPEPVKKKSAATISRQLISALSVFSKTGLTYVEHDGALFQNGMGGSVEVVDENGKKSMVCIDVYDKYGETVDGAWKWPIMAESVAYFGHSKYAVADCNFFIMVNPAITRCIIAKREAFDETKIKNVGGKDSYITRDFRELDLED